MTSMTIASAVHDQLSMPRPPVRDSSTASTLACDCALLRGRGQFEALRADWTGAVTRMARPSLFITPDFLCTAWEHLADPDDEPWFVAVRQGGELVGLLPLIVRRGRYLGLPVRTVSHMAMLAGDRPGILAVVEADRVWEQALQVLLEHRSDWEILDLREIDEGAWPLQPAGQRWLQDQGVTASVAPATWSGCLPISGTAQDYLQARSSQTRQSFRRSERQLKTACPDLTLDVIDDPQQIVAACDRYLAIEARSWKAEAQVELWSDDRERAFLRALLPILSRKGQASVWLLHSAGRDIAGLIRMQQGTIMFERHWTYDPEYGKYSPGTLLRVRAIEQLFGGPCDESDALGMDAPLAQRRSLSSWYPIERRTYRLLALKLPWYHQVIYRASRVAKQLRNRWRAGQAAPAPAEASPASQEG
jgi:CelD/BcsL family acetyltransferase involved in cellulose biosynthesis